MPRASRHRTRTHAAAPASLSSLVTFGFWIRFSRTRSRARLCGGCTSRTASHHCDSPPGFVMVRWFTDVLPSDLTFGTLLRTHVTPSFCTPSCRSCRSALPSLYFSAHSSPRLTISSFGRAYGLRTCAPFSLRGYFWNISPALFICIALIGRTLVCAHFHSSLDFTSFAPYRTTPPHHHVCVLPCCVVPFLNVPHMRTQDTVGFRLATAFELLLGLTFDLRHRYVYLAVASRTTPVTTHTFSLTFVYTGLPTHALLSPSHLLSRRVRHPALVAWTLHTCILLGLDCLRTRVWFHNYTAHAFRTFLATHGRTDGPPRYAGTPHFLLTPTPPSSFRSCSYRHVVWTGTEHWTHGVRLRTHCYPHCPHAVAATTHHCRLSTFAGSTPPYRHFTSCTLPFLTHCLHFSVETRSAGTV